MWHFCPSQPYGPVAPFLESFGSLELRDDELVYFTFLDEFF
jgi:hypothetical protein